MWVQRAGERYRGGDGAGIETRHAFSFSGYYDPENVRFGSLMACNEERLAPGAGFAEHPHRDVEIVTWVVEGELTHEDSTGGRTVVRPGDVQRLSAGGGVRHSERNEGPEPLTFVQLWLTPAPGLTSADAGAEPVYEVVRGLADSVPYVLERADATLSVWRPVGGERIELPAAPWVYAHVVRGEIRLAEQTLTAGDAARITDGRGLWAHALSGAELLVWAMRTEPSYG
ncbi:pirin family protein [Streptomyces sp. NBS 14/10]|uniref:pirin family protein n=1 Tax=Streptomyces sp. NBS 14/10 TaxID=1945643 RepID=UPI000B7EB5C1|nr:pirin-like bicupin family protein [Streptomyces sp. NBS 14/10]KAK1185998.1 pirin family protein [Streptomyces sp. NBS 14/10]